ncbi:MAG: SPASM domain-containing protein, partial [Chlorobium sp.]
GKPEMVTGNIHEKNPVTNPELQELYLSGSDPYIDPVCLECKVLPLCGGGCPSKRLRAKQFGEKGVEFCSPFKVNIITSLERYIESFRTMEICTAVLTPGVEKNDNRGYRVISPEKNS